MSFVVVVGKVNEQPASGQRGVLALADEGKTSPDTELPAASEARIAVTMWPSVRPRRPACHCRVGGVETAPKLQMVDSGR